MRLFPLALLALGLADCITAPTEPPRVPTAVPPSPTVTTPPASPTVSPTPLPTSDFASQDFYGIWSIWDAQTTGYNYLEFFPSGAFIFSHGPERGQIIHFGNFRLDGNILTFEDWFYCDPDEWVGTYLIRMWPDKQWIRFIPIDDPCVGRASDFRSRIVRWNRFAPTSTPSP